MSTTPADRLVPLRRTRQFREFTAEPVEQEALDALADVGRWTGSSKNSQPWRFIVITDPAVVTRLHEVGLPGTRSLATAAAAIAITLPAGDGHRDGHAYDDGRAAERILVGAGMLGLGAGIGWIRPEIRAAAGEILGLPADRFVRSILAIGHPSEAALAPKSAAGSARLPREETVFENGWPTTD